MNPQPEFAHYLRYQRINRGRAGKLYQPVIGVGMPLRPRYLRAMFKTASQAEAYGRRAAKKLSGLIRNELEAR